MKEEMGQKWFTDTEGMTKGHSGSGNVVKNTVHFESEWLLDRLLDLDLDLESDRLADRDRDLDRDGDLFFLFGE